MKLNSVASEFRLYLTNYWISSLPSHALRLFYYRHVMGMRIGPGSNIFMGCTFDCRGGISLGKNSVVNARCKLDGRGGIQIGDYVSVSSDVTILTADHDPDCPDYSARMDEVVIGNNCFIGTSALILKGVHVGAGSIIGAGSVVTRDIPTGEIWAGNPARKIRDRKIEDKRENPPYRRLFQ